MAKRKPMLTNREKGERTVQCMNAQMICPTPWRIPYRTPAGASERATAVSEKTGRLFEAHACVCHFFHVEQVEE